MLTTSFSDLITVLYVDVANARNYYSPIISEFNAILVIMKNYLRMSALLIISSPVAFGDIS